MADYFLLFEFQKNFLASYNPTSTTILQKKLQAFAKTFLAYEKEFIKILKDEYNYLLWDSYHHELALIRREIAFFVANVKKIHQLSVFFHSTPPFFYRCQRRAYGVGFAWFEQLFPISKVFVFLIGAISCKNTLFVKLPSNHSVLTAFVKKVFGAVFPENYLYFVDENISKEQMQSLLRLNFDLLYFNGAYAKAWELQVIFANRLPHFIWDLETKNPLIIDESACIDMVAKQLLFTKLLNNSAYNGGIDYLLIHELVLTKLIATLRKLYPLYYKDNLWAYFAKLSKKDFTLAQGFISQNQAKVLFGGKINQFQTKIELTLIRIDHLKHPIITQFLLSPLLPVIVYNVFSDIPGILAHFQHPNTVFLASKNKNHIKELVWKIPTNYFFVNNFTPFSLRNLPFGKVKNHVSGFLGQKHSIKQLTYNKFIDQNSFSWMKRYYLTPCWKKEKRMKKKIS